METRANNVLVGAFVLLGFALTLGLLVWIARTSDGEARKQFYIVFNGSVQGLSVGAAVLFNGLRVGDVTEIRINPGNTSEIRARVAVNELTPVKRDSRARLTYQGLTGVAAIEISGGTEQAGALVPGNDGVPPAMFAERSFVQNILEGGQDTLQRVNNVVQRVDDIVRENQEAIGSTIRNIQSFSEALAANNQQIATLVRDASRAATAIADVGARLERIVAEIDPARVRETVDSVAAITTAIAEQREEIARFVQDASRAARGLAQTAERLVPTVERAEEILAAIDPNAIRSTIAGIDRSAANFARITDAIDEARIRSTVNDIAAFSATLAAERDRVAGLVQDVGRAARNVADASANLDPSIRRIGEIVTAVDPGAVQRSVQNFERFAASVGAESQRFTRIASEAGELVASLRRSATAIENFTTSATRDGEGGIFGEITRTAQSIRSAAENLDRRITQVSGGLQRFTDSGLRDLSSFVSDGRRTLNNLDRVFRDLERNPQQFIFGRSGVPNYRR